MPEADPKGPSIVTQMDGATKGTPAEANVQANSIAMKPIEPVAAVAPDVVPTPEAPKPAPLVETKTGTVSRTDKANYEEYTANKKVFDKAIADHLADPSNPALEAKFQEAFAKNEEIKNRNGGFAPEPPNDNVSSLIEGDNFDKEWKDQGGQGGSENQVIFKDGLAIKRNYNGKLGQALVNYGGDIQKFNKSVELHNELFPSTKIDIIGESATSDGPAPVFTQAEIKGKPATQKEIIDFMRKKGFEPDGGPNYLNKEAGVRVEDLRTANVLKDANGELHVIDSVIKEVAPKPEAKAPSIAKVEEPIVSSKDYIDELLATGEITKAEHAAQLADLGIKAEAKPITVPAAQPVVDFVIPKELSKSSPRYKTSEVIFEDPLDKALYIIAQDAKRSARDGDFLSLVTEHTGMDEAQARAAGQDVRNRIKALSESTKDGQPITVKKQSVAAPEPIPEAVASEPVAQKASAKVAEPPVLEPAVSPPVLQRVADNVEVARILSEDVYEPKSSEAANRITKFALGLSDQEVANRIGGNVPPPPSRPTVNADDPGYKPGASSYGLGIGKIADFIKVAVGTIEGNIRDANKAIFGVLRNYEYAKSQLSMKLENATMPASRLARKILTKEGNDVVGNLLMSGKLDEAKALVEQHTRYGKEFAQTIDQAREALDYVHQLEVEARGAENVPYVKGYFPRQLISYADFREFLGRDEQGVADAAIKRAQDRSETPLTREQKDAALNNLISQSRMNGGKPGFLKGRTIREIDSNISKFYEPWDVALENYLRKATNDVVNRSYFGKAADGAAWNPTGGSLGKAIADEIAAGRLKGKAQDIVIDNLQDRFGYENAATGISAEIGRKIRFAQSAAFLGQLGTALAQFGDIYGSILHQGPIDTALGYVPKRVGKALGMQEKLSLRDIGIHEGNVETAQFSRRKGAVDKAADLTVKFGVGLSDQFNKGGVANAIRRHYADIMMNPDGADYARLNRDYSRKFPQQWPAMLKELSSKAFQNGDISKLPEAQFFLYNELADIHPINPSGMAQGFNAAHPLAKPLWGLKSYMIKQLDIMRARGYEKIKDPKSRYEGLTYLAAYAAIVAGAQNFSISWLRDHLANRDADTSDYFVGGFLQPLGISRYTINTLRKGEVGKAMVESLLPAVSLAREGINDIGLTRDLLQGRRDKKTGVKTVSDVGSLVSQSELVKHFPVLGSLYYSRAGKGATNEKRRREDKANGRTQLNTVDTISDIISPAETASR